MLAAFPKVPRMHMYTDIRYSNFCWRLCLWKVDWPSATELHSQRLRYHATPRTPVRDSACDVASDALMPQHAQHSARLEDNGTSLIVQVIKCVYDVRNYVISGLCKIFLATSHRETGSINDTRRSFSYFSFFSWKYIGWQWQLVSAAILWVKLL